LCQKVQIEQPTMANTLARMERDGLITRLPDPEDRWRPLVTLMPRAREMESDLVGATMYVNRAATGGLDGEESTMFMTTLSKIIGNLETQQGGIDAAKDHQGR
jgi:DNA-binding MarR family transcriptional regulator